MRNAAEEMRVRCGPDGEGHCSYVEELVCPPGGSRESLSDQHNAWHAVKTQLTLVVIQSFIRQTFTEHLKDYRQTASHVEI